MPPLALISSAAIWAPPGVAAPAIDWISAMTPILIGSPDCADAGDGEPAAMPSAAVTIQKYANFRPGLAMQIAPFAIRLADGLGQAQHRPLAKSNESARRVAAQMRQEPCKFSFRGAPCADVCCKTRVMHLHQRHRCSNRGGICMISINSQFVPSR